MCPRPSGHRLLRLLPRRLPLMSRRPGLLAPAVVVLVASTLPLIAPARTAAAAGAPTLDAAEASAYRPLAHGGDDTGTGIGVPAQRDGQVAPGSAAPPDPGTEPLTVTDREVLYKVKQAGLWEMPVGMWMSERAADPGVRDVGGKISAEHQELDGITNEAAARLGVALPTEPNPDQQGWMREIDAQRGAAFDERAVFLLRQAHGNVLPVLTTVRVETRNPVIREFTTQAMAFVQRHIQYLESTGLVNFEQLPGTSDLTTPGWRSEALTFVLFALVTAVFITLFVLLGRALVRGVRALPGSRRSRTTTPRARAGGHHARS
jgi:predicted outer membrane protein